MANYIEKNGEIILRCANWVMECFFKNFSNVVEQERLKNNKIMHAFLEELDQDIQGRGFVGVEITNYFNHSPDKLPIQLFYDLTAKTIKNIKQLDLGEFQEGVFARLDEFQQKILL